MPKLCLYFSPAFPDSFWAGEHFCFEAPAEGSPRGEWLIGRHPQSDLTLAPMEVSRRHCVIRYSYAADRWSIEDLGSTAYTWLNDRRLTPGDPAPLQIGDRVLVGSCLINIVEDEHDTLNLDDGPTTIVGTTPLDHRTGAALAAPPALEATTPKTWGDTLYLGAGWIMSPTTKSGMAYRLIVLALAAVVAVLILGAL